MEASKDFPLVSIVTLTYRHFDKIEKTIKSVFSQDYPNIEFIICDDGSENFPETIISDILKVCPVNVKIVVVRNKENQGTVKNINVAYRRSHGIYIMNLSAGDVFFTKDVVSKVVKRFQQVSCDVMSTSRIMYDINNLPICMLPHYNDRKKIKKWNSCKKQYSAFISSSFLNMASGSSMYMTRNAIEKIGFFDEKYVLWEDGPFIEKYLQNNMIEPALDIISIWYESCGVSNGVVNPLLKQDADIFHKADRKRLWNNLSKWDKRKIQYRISSFYAENGFQRFLLKIFNIRAFIYFSYLWFCEKTNTILETKKIKRIIEEEKLRNNIIPLDD